MANFYAKIRPVVKDCDISYIEPLSYMKHITVSENSNETSDKIVLLYKKVSKYYYIFLK